jgi:hypothetical protein
VRAIAPAGAESPGYPVQVRGRSTALRVAATASTLLIAATGCTSSTHGASSRTPSTASPSGTAVLTCAQADRNLVGAVQRYVDAYGSPLSTAAASPSSSGSAAPSPSASATTGPSSEAAAALRTAVEAAQRAISAKACELAQFRQSLESDLSAVAARGPVAKAVLMRLTASITGTAQQAVTTISLKPGDDLARRIADLAPGSTVELAAGTFSLDASLALLDGITVHGAGREQTVIQTMAADAALLVLTDARVELSDLTVLHTGAAVGDLVVGGPTSLLVLNRVRISGAVAAKDQGGNGVLMSARASAATVGATTLESTDSIFDHNAGAGVSLSSGHVASIQQGRFDTNDNCGICFAGDSTGAVRGSVFVNDRVGVAVLDHAEPAVQNDTFEGGLFAIQAGGDATPVITGAAVSGATRAAMIFADRSAGSVDGSRCDKVPYGIVVSAAALPLLGTNTCQVARSQ